MDVAQFTIVSAVSALAIGLGIAVLQRNDRSRSHQLFALASLCVALWMVLNFMSNESIFFAHAVMLNRLTMAMGVLVGVSMTAFGAVFPSSHRPLPKWWWAGVFVPGMGFFVATLTTTLILRRVTYESWGTNALTGPLFNVELVWGLLIVLGLIWNCVGTYKAADQRQRVQYGYLFTGLVGLGVTSLIIAGALPLLTGSNEASVYAPVAAVFFLIPAAYAMIKHRLLDMSVVVLRGGTYTLVLGLAGAFVVVLADFGQMRISQLLDIDGRFVLFVVSVVLLIAFQPLRRWIEHVSDGFLYRRSYDPQKFLNDVSRVTSSTLNLAPLAEQIVELFARDMKLMSSALVYRRGDGVGVASSGDAADPDELSSVLGLLNDRTLVLADEIQAADPLRRLLTQLDARVVAPLVLDGGTIGALLLGPKKSGALFTEGDVHIIEISASQAAMSLNNARLFDEKNQRVRELSALNRLATSIGANIELQTLLENALEGVSAATSADSGSIMLLNPADRTLSVAASTGDVAPHAERHLRVGEGISGWVAASRKALVLVNDEEGPDGVGSSREEARSTITAPVIYKDLVTGVVNLSRNSGAEPFSKENLNVVTSFAGQLAVAIENARLYEDLEKTFLGTISALAAAVDAKDPYTYGHSNEVTEHAIAIARRLGIAEDEVNRIKLAAMLHDIGKIGIDGSILHKPGPLDDEELALVRRHPAIGADILAPLEFLSDVVPLILFHHERPDGSGYPSGISGTAIPLGARIISVADSYNAMVSDRPYREGLSAQTARSELRNNAGTQFDADVVDVFMEILDETQ